MPRVCTICTSPEREAIDRALVERSGSIRAIASQYKVNKDALTRHLGQHVADKLAKAGQAEAEEGASLLERLASLRASARRLQAQAEAAGDLRTALAAVRELTRLFELTAKLTGELDTAARVQVNVGVAVDYSPDDVQHHIELAQLALEEERAIATTGEPAHANAALPERATELQSPATVAPAPVTQTSESRPAQSIFAPGVPRGRMTGYDRGGLGR